MGKISLHPDFKDFLRLLNSNNVDYLLVGGYAVSFHGYPRNTGDLDIWVDTNAANAERVARAIGEFGMPEEQVTAFLFQQPGKVIRMGMPPVRIEVLTGISGVCFKDCYVERIRAEVDGIWVNIISLPMLKENKKASGRIKDLDDLQHLP